jgi:hypothetical protein
LLHFPEVHHVAVCVSLNMVQCLLQNIETVLALKLTMLRDLPDLSYSRVLISLSFVGIEMLLDGFVELILSHQVLLIEIDLEHIVLPFLNKAL